MEWFWFFPDRCLWVYVSSEDSGLFNWTPCPVNGTGWSISERCPRNVQADEEAAWAWEVRAGKGKCCKSHPIQSRMLLSRLQVPPTFSALKPLARNRQQHTTLTARVDLPLWFWNIRERSNRGGATLPVFWVVPGSRTSWYLLTENQQREST